MEKKFLDINTTKLVALMFFLFLSASFIFSQVQQPIERLEINENSTLQDLLAVAALNNPGLKGAYEQWQSALQRIPQVKALPNPQLTFTYFIREVETRVGPQQGKVGLMQMFPWFGKLKLKGSAALEAANAAKQMYDNMKLNMFYRVKEAYYDYYYINRSTAILEENIRLLKHLESVMIEKYRTGMASYSSIIKIQVEVDKLQDHLNSTIEVLEPIKAKLNAALDRPFNALLPVPKEMPMETGKEPLPMSGDHLMELLKKNNPGLKSMDAMASKEQINIKLARKDYFPDFSIGVDYILTGEARMPGAADSGKDPVAAMLSIQLPLWAKKNKAAVREANARYRAVLNQRQEEENNLMARLEMVLFQFRDAERKMALYQKSLLPRAEQALEVIRSAFESGKADFPDFIDSHRTLLEFELAYEEARTHRAQRLAELQMLTGRENVFATENTEDTEPL
jgi:cobalt-zinc-cadmium efflux system outer membrane protein